MPIATGNQRDLPVLAFGMSTHAQVLRLRRVRRCLAHCGSDDVAFPLSGQDRHTEVMISELNSWPAFPFARTLKTDRSPVPPSAEGRSGWLNLLRKILSFSIPNRFIPAHPDTFWLPHHLSLTPARPWSKNRGPLQGVIRTSAETRRALLE